MPISSILNVLSKLVSNFYLLVISSILLMEIFGISLKNSPSISLWNLTPETPHGVLPLVALLFLSLMKL